MITARWGFHYSLVLMGVLMWNQFSAAQTPPGVWIAPQGSFKGQLPALTDEETNLAKNLESYVKTLATDIGQRNTRRQEGLVRSVEFLTQSMTALGYDVREQKFQVGGITVKNLDAELKGTTKPEEIVIAGAHYDSVGNSPAANDNGSGVAAVLEMARLLKAQRFERTVRFVFFVNEEPPFFQTPSMGSLVYARRCRQLDEKIVAMLSMETIGCYTDAPKSQKYPPPFDRFFPDTGNFVAFVGNPESQKLVESVVTAFRGSTRFPSEAIAAPSSIEGIGFSDQWSFWQCGYSALMVTDTAMFRYPHYHTTDDTPDKIDYDRMARVVGGVARAVRQLAAPVP